MAWLLALLKAIPGLSKLLSKLEENMRHASAEKRRKEKHSRVDDRIDRVLRVRDDETK